MYFTDRFYSHEELPSDHKVNVSAEGKTAPSMNIVMADKLSQLPAGSGDPGHRKELNKQKIGTALKTTASGHDYIRGFLPILYSIGWSPLKFWKKEVSVFNCLRSFVD